MMSTREELTDALSAFQAAWDTTMEELNELTSLPGFPDAELDPNNEERIVELNEELCNLAEWMKATNAAIRQHDKEHQNVSD